MELSISVDERIESIARTLDMLTKIHLDNDREYRERFEEIAAAQRETAAAQRENEKRFAAVTHNFEIVLESIKRLEARQ